MKNNFKILIILFLFTLSYSCKKNKVGGKASIKGVVLHHSKPIANAYVYIKYNSTDFPGNDYNLYDTYVIADGEGNYSINVFKGSYYIYASGLDADVKSPFIVKGGLSFSIRNKEHLTKNIAVTED